MSKTDIYQIVTDRIIELLEKGVIPWKKPWSGKDSGIPRNLISGKAYRGVNVFMLASMGYANPYWMTYKQAQSKGGSVRKGEKGTMAVFWKMFDAEKEGKPVIIDGKKKVIPMLRFYTVFNAEQCENIETPYAPEEDKPFDPIAACDSIVVNMQNRPKIKHEGSVAGYQPEMDYVCMPNQGQFMNPEHYYKTLFHELAHSTAHASRVGREITTSFGKEAYAKEELIAEMGASFLCAFGGISSEDVTIRAASYIQGWLKALKNDRKLVVSASAAAQKAADYILGTTFTVPEATE
jgi:antirestriction protein ArdC